ncbi:MAG: class I SAM-dependent methyltransferase [Nanoarchaeota archaeon]
MENLTEKNRKFFDMVARYYDSGILKAWLNGILERAWRQIKVNNNSKILDAGCGTGNFLKILEDENKSLELYGIDISSQMLKIAKNKLKNKAKLSLVAVEKIKYKNKFDYIFSAEAFHHYENQDKAMENFNIALKKKGKLIIVDLSFGRILNWLFNKIEPGNSKMNSSSDFLKIFKLYKFRNIKQKRLGLFVIMTIGEK